MSPPGEVYEALTLTTRAVEAVAKIADQHDKVLGTWIRRSVLYLVSVCVHQHEDGGREISRCEGDLEICAKHIGSGRELRRALQCLIRLNQCFKPAPSGPWTVRTHANPTVSVC